jgi:hypothetical protein
VQTPSTLDPDLLEAFAAKMGTALAVAENEPFPECLLRCQDAIGSANLEIILLGAELGYLDIALEAVMRGRGSDYELCCELRKLATDLVLLVTIPLSIVFVLLLCLMPWYGQLFDEMLGGEPLPRSTELVLHLIHLLIFHWHCLLVGIGIPVVCLVWTRSFRNCQRVDRQMCRLPVYRRQCERRFEYRWASTIGAFMEAGLPRDNACGLVREKCPRIAEIAVAIIAQEDKKAGSLLRELDERRDKAELKTLKRTGRICKAAIVCALILLVAGIFVGLLLPLLTMDCGFGV